MKRCNKCNLEYQNEMNFCKKCGSELEKFETKEEKQERELKKQKNQKTWKIVRYVFGTIIILGSLLDSKGFKLYDFFGILFGISLLPIIYKILIKESKISKVLAIIIPIVLGFTWAICLPGEELESINIKDNGHTIAVNENYKIDFDTNLKKINIKDFDFVSSNNNIATVKDGIVIGKNEGNVEITIKGKNNVEQKVNYTIKYVDIFELKIEGDIRLLVGKKGKLNVVTTPIIVSDKIKNWESSNSEIISVDENGNITANNKGKSTITIVSEKGKTASIEVSAFINVNTLEIQGTNLKVEKGKTISLGLNITPENADLDGITWSSSNNSIATVENGVITGVKEGTVTITATSVNGVKTEKRVEVFEVKPESISLNKSSLSLSVGQTTLITANVNPNNASDKSVFWSTSSYSVATVDNGVITAKGIGTATITARTSNGKTSIVSVTVTKNAPIKVNNFRYTKDSVCGVEWNFSLTNNSGKTINYVTLKWYNFNSVGDPVYDQINSKNYIQLRYTGPLNPGQNSGSKRNTTKFYNCSYSSSAISDVKIDYADGTSETISSSNIKYYINLY